MRTILLAAALAIASGCADTRGAKRSPVVSESPTISERLRVNRQRGAEQAMRNDTVISGEVSRE